MSKILTRNENGYVYRIILGEADNKRTAIVWRTIEGLDYERDKEILEDILTSLNPDEVYINGQALLSRYKIIDKEFRRLMMERREGL